MAKSILEVVLQGVDKLSGPVRKAGESVKDFEKRTKASSDGVKKFGVTALKATGTLAALGIAAKKAFDMAKEGAAIKQTGQSFGFLMEKVGASADTLAQLRAASKGTISDMDLMSSTATLLAGAQGELGVQMAKATPQLMSIAKAAQKLNPSLGNTTYLYNSLALGIKRGSPLILDNLGLLVSVGDANKKLAAALGKTVAELTSEEQKMALLNETMRAGNVLVAQAGGTTDSATDSYIQLEVAVDNVTDAIKVQTHEGMEPLVRLFADAVGALVPMANAQLGMGQAVRDGIISTQEYNTALYAMKMGALDAEGVTRGLEDAARELGLTEEAAAAASIAVSAALGQVAFAASAAKDATDGLAAAAEDLTWGYSQLFDATYREEQREMALIDAHQNLYTATREVEDATDDLGEEFVQTGNEALDLAIRIGGLTVAQFEYMDALQGLDPVQRENRDNAERLWRELETLGYSYTHVTTSTDENTDTTEQWSKIQDLARLAAGDTTQAILDQEAELAELTRLVEENDFQDQGLIRTWVAAQVQLGLLSDEFTENSRSVRDNTAALAENALKTERNQALKDQYALASGRATVETILLEGQIRAATEAFVAEGVASGYTAQQIANMRVQLDAATGALRGGVSAANAGASALDNYTVSARAAWEAAQRLGSRGPGQLGGPPPGEYEGEGGAERFAEEQGWQVSAAGRDQEKHAKQVLGQIVAEQSGVWESGGDMSGWVKEFMMSGAGTGLAAGFDESVVNAAIQDLEIQKANAAQGLSGIVPGGYPRDSFLIGATSGEHVQITPQNMMRGAGMGGAMVINTVNVFGVQTDSQLFDAVTRVARQRGRAFARVM
jgi:hypothetical protein